MTKTVEETAQCLLDIHIPNDLSHEDTQEQGVIRSLARITPDTTDAPFFTGKEIAIAIKTFKNNKAPGSVNHIEVKVLKISIREIPKQFLRVFNGCLQWGVFPTIWKKSSLRILLKGEDKDVKNLKSYQYASSL